LLYSEGWQGGQKDFHSLIVAALVGVLVVLSACEEQSVNPNRHFDSSDFEGMKNKDYALNSRYVRESLAHLYDADRDSAMADFRTRSYYRGGEPLIWVDRSGADSRADTLIAWLHAHLSAMGFSERAFGLQQMESDLQRLRTLDFDADNAINDVAARLEYMLTKAYLRFAMGQRFGFTDPRKLFNNLDVLSVDTLGHPTSYARLFDVDMQHPGNNYAHMALRKVANDSLSEYLADCQPTDSLYHRFCRELSTAKGHRRTQLLCNMERRRWREHRRPEGDKSYVLVNVAAYHLWAVSPDTILDMRVGCGASHTKTPLLSSYFTRMDVNPEWIIPMSIVHKDILKHAGDPSYFNRHGYYIADRKTGQRMDLASVTEEMLASGRYRVTQPGGAGNALGRIIFRFPNNFSVFLHDTSSRSFFSNDNRGVSHGCVRVQKPFELASFLLGTDDEWLLDKLRITMGLPPQSERGIEYMAREDRPAHPTFMRNLNIPSRVPLYITYYTLYPDPTTGQLCSYTDVYKYDKVLERALRWFVQ
jgi:hypothetical protein